MDKEFKKKMKEELWKLSKEEYSLKDRIHIKVWWYLRPILPARKDVRQICKQIKRATKLLKD